MPAFWRTPAERSASSSATSRPERLATEIAALAKDPGRLAQMAEAAKSAGTIDAAERLADLVIKVAGI